MNTEILHQARTTDIVEYLVSRGETLTKTGNYYKHSKHDSLVFKGNSYYWNSRNEYGNAVDFLMSYYDMDFNTAIEELTSSKKKKEIDSLPRVLSTSFLWSDIELCQDLRRTMAYLTITRKIDVKIVQELINKKLIYQENHTNNIIFPMYDENRQIVGVELCGTLSNKKFKGFKEGSAYGYGFNVPFADADGGYNYALFFESAVDLISFIEISRLNNKPLTACLLVSLGGVKENIIKYTLTAFKTPSRPLSCVLCVDNDKAGENLCKTLTASNTPFKTHFPQQEFKDWNEQLVNLKK